MVASVTDQQQKDIPGGHPLGGLLVYVVCLGDERGGCEGEGEDASVASPYAPVPSGGHARRNSCAAQNGQRHERCAALVDAPPLAAVSTEKPVARTSTRRRMKRGIPYHSTIARPRRVLRSCALVVSKRVGEPALTTARADLGEEAFEVALAEGRALALDEAMTYALQVLDDTAPAPPPGLRA